MEVWRPPLVIMCLGVTLFWGEISLIASGVKEQKQPAVWQRDTHSIRFVQPTDPAAPNRRSRVMDAARSVPGALMPDLYVLLPEKVARTATDQPVLYWYLSRPIDRPIKISIHTPGDPKPSLKMSLDGDKLAGIQRLDLSRLSVRLQEGIRYDWVITIVVDPDTPSENIFAKSILWRVRPTQELIQRMRSAGNAWQRAAIAAHEGFWIDALSELTDLINHHPDDLDLRRTRADLLRQVGFDVEIEPRSDQKFHETIRFTAPEIQFLSP